MNKVKTITPLPPADFTPEIGDYKTLRPFRYWCQKVLPLVYDDSLSYYELLCKIVDYLNKTMEDVETLHEDVTNLSTAYEQLQNYVNTYFSSLDVQNEINNKIDEMASDGTLTALFGVYNDKRYIEITLPTTSNLEVNMLANSSWTYDNGFKYIGGNGALYSEQYFNADTRYLVSFSTDKPINGEYFTVKIGDTENIVTYNGTSNFEFGIKTLSGGRLTIEPLNDNLINTVFTNFNIKRIISPSEANFVVVSDNGEITREETRYKIRGYYYGLNNGMFAFDANNISIGNYTASELTTGYFNTIVGNNTFKNGNVATRNTIIGYSNMINDRVGDRNTVIGTFIANGKDYTRNVFIGSDCASLANNVSNCVVIGASALYGGSGKRTVIIGNNSGYYGGDNNVIIGNTTGTQLTGGDNVVIGFRCALDLTEGSNNVYIGSQITQKSKTGDGYVNINDLIAGNKSGYIQIGSAEEIYFGNVGYNNKGIMFINRTGNGSFVCAQNSDNMGGYTIHDISANKNVVELKCERQDADYIMRLICNQSDVINSKNGLLMLPVKPSTSKGDVGTIFFDGDDLKIVTNSGIKKVTLE